MNNNEKSRTRYALNLALGIAALLLLGGQALAAPTTFQVCKNIVGNGDTIAQGGTFQLDVSATPGGSLGSFPLVAVEGAVGVAGATVCSTQTAIPVGTTAITVSEAASRPANWGADASSFPRWTLTGTGLSGATTGTTQVVTIEGTQFSNASGNLVITFQNMPRRTVQACYVVEDNGAAPVEGTGMVTLQVSGNTVSTSIPGTEGSSTCASTLYEMTSGISSFTERMVNSFGFTNAAGYPKYEVRDATNTLIASGPVSAASGQTPSISLDQGSGDLKVTIFARPAKTRTLRICKRLEGGGDPAGNYSLYYTVSPATASANIASYGWTSNTASTETKCQLATSVLDTERYNLIGDWMMPAAYLAHATGYPKWEMYVDNGANDSAGTPLAGGLNEGAGGTVSSAQGEFVQVDWNAISADTPVKVVIVNHAGPAGNGSQPGTGEVLQLCKRLDDGPNVSPNLTNQSFTFEVRGSGSTGTTSNMPNTSPPVHLTVTASVGPTVSGVNEAGSEVCYATLATPSWMGGFTIVEIARSVASGWPGDAAGYPKIEVWANGGAAASQTFDTVLSNNRWGTASPATAGYIDIANIWPNSYTSSTILPAKTDGKLVFVNKPDIARKLTVCLNVLDNGLAPAGQTASMLVPGSTAIGATAEGSTACSTQQFLPADTSVYVQGPETLSWTSNGFALGYPNLEFQGATGSGSLTAAQLLQVPGASAGTSNSFALYLPASIWSATTGDVTVTINVKFGPDLQVCKRVLDNRVPITGDGTFGFSSTTASAGALRSGFAASLTATEGGPDVCTLVLGATATAANWNWADPGTNPQWSAAESLPSGYPSLTTGFPRWELRGANVADATGNVYGGLIASGSASTSANGLPAPSSPEATGKLTLLYINRTGPDRFVRVCTSLVDNADALANGGALFNYSAEMRNLLAAAPTASTSIAGQSATEGVNADLSSGLQCSSQIDITTLDPTANFLSVVQSFAAGWAGSASGYPTWQVYDQDYASTALSGSGATADISLASISTPNFYIVFTNKALLAGSLRIDKTVSGAPASGVTGSFTFDYTCNNGGPSGSTSVTLAAATSGSSAVITGVPVGSSCTVTETGQPAQSAYSWTGLAAAQTSTAISDGELRVLSFTNTLTPNPGGLTVSKTITGAPGSAILTSLSFPFTVTCQTPTATYGGTVTVSAGSLTSSTTIGNIPAGSTNCVITETVASRPAPPSGYEWGTPSYTQPVATALPAGETISGAIVNGLSSNQQDLSSITSVPTLGDWALLMLIGALALSGAASVWHRRS